MSFFRKRLQGSVYWLTAMVAFPALSDLRAGDQKDRLDGAISVPAGGRLPLASASSRPTAPPKGFRSDRVTLRNPAPQFSAPSPVAGDPAMRIAAASDSPPTRPRHPLGFRASAPALTADPTAPVPDPRLQPQGLPIPNGASPLPDGTLPTVPGVMLPGEELLLVPEELPPPVPRARLAVPEVPPEIPPEMEEEEETPEEKPLYSINPWTTAESPVFGTEEITEFTQQIVAEGRWSLRPYIGLTTYYDGNVFIDSEDSQKDFVVRVSPGLFARLGNDETALFVVANYALNGAFYLNNTSEDTFDQTGKVDLRWRFAKVTVGLRVGVESATIASVDAGGRVQRTTYYAGVTSRYAPHEKISVDLNSDYRVTRAEGLIGATESRVQAYLDYHYSPKLSFGAGGEVGTTAVEDSSDQTFQQVTLRTNYASTAKLSLAANVGLEFRQFESGGDAINPVFGLSAAWAAREGTNALVSAQRRIFSSSSLEGQNYTSSAVLVSVQQRMTDRFDLFFTAGYENLSYSAAGGDDAAGREENSFLLRGGIQWHSVAWLNIGIFYEYSQNFSSADDDRSFQRDRIGTQINFLF